MKFLSFIAALVLLVSCSKDDSPGPDPNPNPTPQNDSLGAWQKYTSVGSHVINDIAFVDEATGFYVASGFGVFKSTDSGKVWNKVQLPVQANNLVTLNFRNTQQGYAVGEFVFAYTIDAGNTWTVKTQGQVAQAVDVSFPSTATGYIAAADGIYKTQDTGTTWVRVRTGSFSSVSFVDDMNGWASSVNLGAILKTSDGGVTWTSQTNTAAVMPTIFFLDAQRGWATGPGFIMRTTNGGQNWQMIPTNWSSFDVQFIDANLGYVTAGSEVYRSTDGGATWVRENKVVGVQLVELFFLNASKGWAAGSSGTILRKP